jgi:hypothetical protein
MAADELRRAAPQRRLRCAVCGRVLPTGAPAGVCPAGKPITSNLAVLPRAGAGRRRASWRAAAGLPLFGPPA